MAHSKGIRIAQLINTYSPPPRQLTLHTIMSSHSTSPQTTPGDNSGHPSPSPPSSALHSPPAQHGGANSKNTHICDQCSRGFSRAEHLERHQTTHMPSTVSKSFICPHCSKGFTRKDVLTRHIRAVHETKKSEVRKSRRKSCRRCATFKIKCTGGGKNRAEGGGKADEPCEACKKREVECFYDFGAPIQTGDSRRNSDSRDVSHDEDMGEDSESEERSEAITGSSEYSIKRRKTAHNSSAFGPTQHSSFLSLATSGAGPDVSPHLLSAARLASTETASDTPPPLRRRTFGSIDSQAPELSAADQLMYAVTGNTYEKAPEPSFGPPPAPPKRNGVQTSESSPQLQRQPIAPRVSGANGDYNNFSNLYYTPAIRDQNPSTVRQQTGLGRIPEEDLNAASTLQGIKPNPPTPAYPPITTSAPREQPQQWGPMPEMDSSRIRPMSLDGLLPPLPYAQAYDNSMDGLSTQPLGPYDSSRNSEIPEPNVSSSTFVAVQPEPLPESADPTLGMALDIEDNWFFDFGVFEHQTDWLRDWGAGGSSQSGSSDHGPTPYTEIENLNNDPFSTADLGETPAPRMPSVAPSVREPSPKSCPVSEDGSGSAVRSEEDRAVPGLNSFLPMKDHATNVNLLPWGWHGLSEYPKTKLTLPPLRQMLPDGFDGVDERDPRVGTYSPSPSEGWKITDQLRMDMVRLLALPSHRPAYPSSDGAEVEAKFPSGEYISEFIRLYFKYFHPIFPVIHKATFSVEECPSILVVAMASIGASYSTLKNSKSFADNLSELCKRCLMWMAETNPDYPRSVYFLQALCLQNLYALGSGSHSLYDHADVSRSTLIGNARRIGLFSGNPAPAQSSTNTSSNSAPSSPNPNSKSRSKQQNQLPTQNLQAPENETDSGLEGRWRYWREQEGFKRLAWGIFEYDSSFSTLSNRRGAITLSDISTRMPCSEALWDAPTSMAWRQIFVGSNTPSLNPDLEIKGYPFYTTFKDIMGGRMDPKELTSWGRRICSQALGRIMWDFKELEESVLATVLVGGIAQFNPAKGKLLNCLGVVSDSAIAKPGDVDGDETHLIIARLIAHYTHLHAAFPMITIILSLARSPNVPPVPPAPWSSTAPGASARPPEDQRPQRLKAMLAADAAQSRSLAWHAAQIIALSRHKPVFSPVEGMRIFMAGIVLWAIGRYFRAASFKPALRPGDLEPEVRLDQLSWHAFERTPRSPIELRTPGGGVNHRRTPSGSGASAITAAAAAEAAAARTARKDVEEWIRSGKGIATISVDGSEDRTIAVCGEDGAREALRIVASILGALRVWGLGGEFRRLLEELLRDAN